MRHSLSSKRSPTLLSPKKKHLKIHKLRRMRPQRKKARLLQQPRKLRTKHYSRIQLKVWRAMLSKLKLKQEQAPAVKRTIKRRVVGSDPKWLLDCRANKREMKLCCRYARLE